MNLIILLATLLVLLFWIMIIIIRNNWVYKRRVEWIKQDVYNYQNYAPSYYTMLFKFWIWDMRKFGKSI